MLFNSIKKIIFLILFILSFTQFIYAQANILIIPSATQTFIFAPELPDVKFDGFNVYRAEKFTPYMLQMQLENSINKISEDYKNKFDNFKCEIAFLQKRKEVFGEMTDEEIEKLDPQILNEKREIFEKWVEEEGKCEKQIEKLVSTREAELKNIQAEYETKIKNAQISTPNFIKINETPITPIKSPPQIKELVGDAIEQLAKQMNVDSVEKFVDNLLKNKTYAYILSQHSPPISQVIGKLYIDKNVEKNSAYAYKISLIDSKSKKETNFSDEVNVIVAPPTISSPTEVKATPLDKEVELTWKLPEEPRGNILGFRLFRSTSENENFEKINPTIIAVTGKLYYLDSFLTNGTTYYYKLTSVDMVGNESEPSETVFATPKDITPPNIPEDFKVSIKEKTVEMEWKMNLETDLAGYNLYKSDKVDGEYKKINEQLIPPEVTSYKDIEFTEGALTFYRISAVDKTENESQLSTPMSIYAPDTTPPITPVDFTSKTAKGSVDLTWKPNEEKDLIGYNIYRGNSPNDLVKMTPTVIPTDKTSYIDYGLVGGDKYYYSITAVDTSFNESPMSEPIEVSPIDNIPPLAPVGLYAEGSDKKVEIRWAKNMEKDLAGYNLYWQDDKNKNFEKIKTIEKTEVGYIDTEVKNGITYYYKLSAVDESENESEQSESAFATPKDGVPPTTPSDLQVELLSVEGNTGSSELPVPGSPEASAPVSKLIKISWKKTTEEDLRGYIIYRTEEIPTGIYEPLTPNPGSAGSLDTAVILEASRQSAPEGERDEFLDTTVKIGKTYFYKITAKDTSGNESERSKPAGPVGIKEEEEKEEEEKEGEKK